jgi:hypothetical protein
VKQTAAELVMKGEAERASAHCQLPTAPKRSA